MITTTIRVPDEIGTALEQTTGTKSAGAIEAATAYVYIRRATWHELKGFFKKAEVTALLDMFNGTMLTPQLQYQPEVLRAKIEDGEKYEGSCTRHGADVKKLLEKTDKLTSAQVYVLQQELVRAWEKNVQDQQVIDETIKFLSK